MAFACFGRSNARSAQQPDPWAPTAYCDGAGPTTGAMPLADRRENAPVWARDSIRRRPALNEPFFGRSYRCEPPMAVQVFRKSTAAAIPFRR